MGVMSCDRKGCDSIMCDHYSSEYGYICYECISEYNNDSTTLTISAFMESVKQSETSFNIKECIYDVFHT